MKLLATDRECGRDIDVARDDTRLWLTLRDLTTGRAKIVHLAICGCGPAAIGLLSFLKRSHLLADFLERGLVVIDASAKAGVGRLGSYRIPANSHGKVFAECITNAFSDDPNQFSTAAGPNLVFGESEAPMLSDAATALRGVSASVLASVAVHPRSLVMTGTSLMYVRRWRNAWRLVLRDGRGNTGSLVAKNVILALGGKQSRSYFLSQPIADNITLMPHASRVVGSDVILREPHRKLIRRLGSLRGNGRVVVVGSSHSALSVVGRLRSEWERRRSDPCRRNGSGWREILIAHRSPIKYYHPNAEEARRAGYVFDPVLDVCPVTGKVNRYGGLRYQAAKLARRLERDGLAENVWQVALPPSMSRGEARSLRRLLSSAGLIVPCTGYQARDVSILDQTGRQIPLERDPDGGLHVDNNCRVYSARGQPLQNIYGTGLGAGMRVGSEAGGEPAFTGRLDAVYLYHNDVARILTRQLVA